MNDWFTVEEIDALTYAVSEYRHWEETHCYLLCGQDKAVLIDNRNLGDIKEAKMSNAYFEMDNPNNGIMRSPAE